MPTPTEVISLEEVEYVVVVEEMRAVLQAREEVATQRKAGGVATCPVEEGETWYQGAADSPRQHSCYSEIPSHKFENDGNDGHVFRLYFLPTKLLHGSQNSIPGIRSPM